MVGFLLAGRAADRNISLRRPHENKTRSRIVRSQGAVLRMLANDSVVQRDAVARTIRHLQDALREPFRWVNEVRSIGTPECRSSEDRRIPAQTPLYLLAHWGYEVKQARRRGRRQ